MSLHEAPLVFPSSSPEPEAIKTGQLNCFSNLRCYRAPFFRRCKRFWQIAPRKYSILSSPAAVAVNRAGCSASIRAAACQSGQRQTRATQHITTLSALPFNRSCSCRWKFITDNKAHAFHKLADKIQWCYELVYSRSRNSQTAAKTNRLHVDLTYWTLVKTLM